MRQAKTTSLVALLAVLPVLACAFEPLADTQLSDVTGRDGITVTIDTPSLLWDQTIYDRDGVPDDGTGQASVLGIPTSMAPGTESAIVMRGLGVTPGGPIVINVDTGQSSAGAVLNITAAIPDGTVLHLPDLQTSVPTTPGGWELDASQTKTIFSAGTVANPGIEVEFGAATLNLQLGNVAQTMVVGGSTYHPLLLTDLSAKQGLHIENMTISDVSNVTSATYNACGTTASPVACAMTSDDIFINDNDGTLAATKGTSDLTIKGLGMSITENGVAFAVDQLGYRDTLGVNHGINVQIDNVHLGDPSVPGLGNAYIRGLQLGPDAVLTVAGH